MILREIAEAEDRRRRRQAADELVRLAAIAESSSDAIVGLTLDGTVTSWNAAAERIYGLPAAEALGAPVARALSATVRSALEHAGGRVELVLSRAREQIDVELMVSPDYDAAGDLVGASAIARDVSERRRAERESKSLQDQLHQAQKMEAVAALAGGIAHDFNRRRRQPPMKRSTARCSRRMSERPGLAGQYGCNLWAKLQ